MNFTCPNCKHTNWIACNSAYDLITHFVCDCGRLVALIDGEWKLASAPADAIALLDLTTVVTGVATPASGTATSHLATPPPLPPPRKKKLPAEADTYDPEAVEDVARLAHEFEKEATLALASAHKADDIPHNPYLAQALLMPMWKPEPEKQRPRNTNRRRWSSVAAVAAVVLFAGGAAAFFATPRTNAKRTAIKAPSSMATAPALETNVAHPQHTAPEPTRVAAAVQPVQVETNQTQTVPSTSKLPQIAQKPAVAPKRIAAPAPQRTPVAQPPKAETVAPKTVAKKPAPKLVATDTTPLAVKDATTKVSPHKAETPKPPKHEAKAKPEPSVLAAATKADPKKVWDEVECRLADEPPPQCAKWVPIKKVAKKTASVSSDLPKYLDKGAINTGLARVKARVRACEVRGLGRGLVVVKLKVRANGTVERVDVVTTPTTPLGQCVAERVTPATFAKTQNGATFSYVYSFR